MEGVPGGILKVAAAAALAGAAWYAATFLTEYLKKKEKAEDEGE